MSCKNDFAESIFPEIRFLCQLLLLIAGISGVMQGQITSTSLTVNPTAESSISQQVTLTATVNPSTVTGKVAFYSDTNFLGSASLSGGVASLSTKFLVSGNQQLHAYYIGDGANSPSRSGPVAYQVQSGVGISFQPGSVISTGDYPAKAILADLNNDGIPDLVVPNRGDNSIEVRLGNGDGTFSSRIPFPYPYGSPTEIIAVDVDLDGALDLVIADATSSSPLILYWGNGDGTFFAHRVYSGSHWYEGMVVADFNEDGYPDLAIGDGRDSSINIYFGNGNYFLSSPTIIPISGNVISLAVADFNRDGHADLVTGVSAANQMVVLSGNGDGTFQPYMSYPTPPDPTNVATADLNHDGYSDVVITSFTNSSISIFLNNGSGSFASNTGFSVGGAPFFPVLGDINGDGKIDIVVSNSIQSTIDTYLGDGTGSFSLRTPSIHSLNNPFYLALGDLNNDHILDVLYVQTSHNQIDVLLGEPVGNVATVSGTPQSTTINTNFATAMQVLVEDSLGNPVSGVTVKFTAPVSGPGGSFASSASVLTDGSGIATAPAFTANAIGGTYSVVATVLGNPASAVFSLTNTGGVVGQIVLQQQPSSAAAGSVISPAVVVQLQDGAGNHLFVPGTPVTLTLSTGTGVLSGTTTVSTNASGAAVFGDLSIDQIGVKNLTASSAGVPSVISVPFNIVTPGTGTLSVFAGTDQSTHPGTAFPVALKARFLDIFGLPVVGASVTFTVPSSGPRGTFTHSAVVLTDASGIATAPDLIANHLSGVFEVKATASGVNLPAIFRLTNLGTASGSLKVQSVVNAASYFRVISADSLITVFGENFSPMPIKAEEFPLPTELGGISVTVDGYPAPLLYVDQNQINFQLPDVATLQEIPDLASVLIAVHRKGIGSYTVVFPLRETSPGIFVIPETLHAAARNQDFSLNSGENPVASGGIVLLYTTGLGPVDPKVKTGDAAPAEPLSWTTEEVSVTVGNQPAKVLFSGLAPGFAGLMQINLEVPEHLQAGEHAVTIRSAGLVSNTAMISVGNYRK